MNRFFELGLSDLRCFKGRQAIRLKPLTFLVGENSTGKTSILGSLQTVSDFLAGWSPTSFPVQPTFNAPPYQMGTFRDIVRRANPKKDSFTIDAKFLEGDDELTCSITFMEEEFGSEAGIKQVVWALPEISIGVVRQEKEFPSNHKEFQRLELAHQTVGLFSKEKKLLLIAKTENEVWPYPYHLSFLHNFINTEEIKNAATKKKLRPFRNIYETRGLRYSFLLSQPTTSSIAPIRSKPERTYNPIGESPAFEGGEMPLLFRNLKRQNPSDWKKLKAKLVEYGEDAGLFSDISVQTLGSNSSSNPFQLKIKTRGARSNYIDVGYGVSQIMPILVRILQDTATSTHLLQQPEVHLHPRAQASFISFIISLLEENSERVSDDDHIETNQFILETHSDYMIDRVRIEIRKEKIDPDDVGLVYLEPKGNYVEVHNISFDKNGDFIGMPESYKEFFLSETKNLLGF